MAEAREASALRLRRLRAERPDWNREKNARWKSQNADKAFCHKEVEAAVRKGLLTKQPCERCGSTDLIHAHHDDYSKPLDVRWLCPIHHRERHRELGPSGAARGAERRQGGGGDRTILRGSAHPRAKLTEQLVQEIRQSPEPAPRIAERLGVCRALIYQVRKNEIWKSVAPADTPNFPGAGHTASGAFSGRHE